MPGTVPHRELRRDARQDAEQLSAALAGLNDAADQLGTAVGTQSSSPGAATRRTLASGARRGG